MIRKERIEEEDVHKHKVIPLPRISLYPPLSKLEGASVNLLCGGWWFNNYNLINFPNSKRGENKTKGNYRRGGWKRLNGSAAVVTEREGEC